MSAASASLTGKSKRYLRGLAHDLEPLARVGQHGLSDAFLAEFDQALEHHELVKVKFVDWKDDKKALTAEMAERLDAQVAGMIGHHAILFRPARLPENRRIRLP